jgi:cytochrome P450
VTGAQHRAAGVCPIIDHDYRDAGLVLSHYASLNAVRELGPITWNETPRGFWMVNRYDEVREALQMNDVFTNVVTSALSNPASRVRLLPQNLNGAEHVKYRHVVNPWFSPPSIKKVVPLARARCIAMLDDLQPKGSCDLAHDFAMIFPTEIFLGLLGLPVEDGTLLLPLVEGLFRGFFGGDPAEMATTVEEVRRYYRAIVDDRMARPRDITTDFVSYLLSCRVDGEPLPYDDVVTLSFTIMIAGLDTTRSALGYIFHHLATHPGDRQTLIDQPERIPDAVEEFLRLYTLLLQDGRYVDRDIDFNGCPMKEGDVIWLGLASANRDPRRFERPDEFMIDRAENKHLGFGAGAHRCLGAHLARSELILVLEEWLVRIPHFRLADDEPITERGGQLMLTRVPLRWDV